MRKRRLRLWRLGESRVWGRCSSFSRACGLFLLLVFAISSFPAGAKSETNVESPYGVYADIMKGQENAFVPKNLELMRQADLAWVRCDFYWDTVEHPRGTWQTGSWRPTLRSK